LNQQDMQVEGCGLTVILSPRVHQFTSKMGDRIQIRLKGKLLGCHDLILVQSMVCLPY